MRGDRHDVSRRATWPHYHRRTRQIRELYLRQETALRPDGLLCTVWIREEDLVPLRGCCERPVATAVRAIVSETNSIWWSRRKLAWARTAVGTGDVGCLKVLSRPRGVVPTPNENET